MIESYICRMIRDLRFTSDLTQEQFAVKIGVEFSTVNRWENGRGMLSPLAILRIEELKKELEQNE